MAELVKLGDSEYYTFKDLIEEAISRRDKDALKNIRYILMTKYLQNRDTEYLLGLIGRVI